MSHIIPFTLSQVSDVAVAVINATATNTVQSSGGTYQFGGLVLSQSGEPNKVYAVNGGNYISVLGNALHPSKGVSTMSMRYLKEALGAGTGFVVPVVGSDAKRPVISLKAPTTDGDSHIAIARVLPFASDIDTEVDELVALYPIDGDVTDRSISIIPVVGKAGFYTLTLTKNYANGAQTKQLEVEVSFDPEALNESGYTAYIADVLEKSKFVGISLSDTFDSTKFTSLAEVNFTGGTRGDLNNLQASDYAKAILALRNYIGAYQAVIGLGVVDAVVVKDLQGIARDRRIDAFFDVPPNLTYEEALDWMNASAFESQESCFYHFPYKATDLFYSSAKSVWGISSIAYGAKLKGVQSVSASVGGYHLSPAGSTRGVITRSGVEELPNLGEPNYSLMVAARINKIGLDDGKLIIDDALTATSSNTYLKFQHVPSIFNSMARTFYANAMKLKHEPDGVTLDGLNTILRKIGEDYVAVGALVPPRNPDEDGTEPFKWAVVQKEFDMWEVLYFGCPTGSSRRIGALPIVVR